MSPSTGLTQAAVAIVQMVRPELNKRQAQAAAEVIAADVRPDAETIRPEDVRRAQVAVDNAIARQTAGARATAS